VGCDADLARLDEATTGAAVTAAIAALRSSAPPIVGDTADASFEVGHGGRSQLMNLAAEALNADRRLRRAVRESAAGHGMSIEDIAVAASLSRKRVAEILDHEDSDVNVSRAMAADGMTYHVTGRLSPGASFRLVDGLGRVWARQFNATTSAQPVDARYTALSSELALHIVEP
jgi:hypothetical protein